MRIIDYCHTLNLPIGASHRGDCPLCQGKHSFGVTNTGLKLMWNCFRPECKASGQKTAGLHQDTFKTTSEGREDKLLVINHLEEPPHWVNLERSSEALEYLKEVNCWEFFLTTMSRFAYDVKQNRVVFKVWYLGQLVDAVGRTLDGAHPKWTRYGTSNVPFVSSANKFRRAVIVEDAASACSLEQVGYAGVALLGTNLLASHLKVLRGSFDEVTVCLDKDASTKGVDMMAEIGVHLPVRLRLLERDLKQCSSDEIREILG